MMCVEYSFKQSFILIKYEMKKQDYGARLYFKLVWNKLNNEGNYINLHMFGDLAQKKKNQNMSRNFLKHLF
jgi:hypothetical protein